MSKSLLNLLVQISKLCQKSEFQIKFENVLFLELGPARPSPSLTHRPHPFVFLLWPLGHEAAATGRPSAASRPSAAPSSSSSFH
jgi:hypothetical protein